MNMFRLALTNLFFRKQNAVVSILLMAFGTALVCLILNVKDELENEASNSVEGIDMVIGAKGSPLQLILANVFHIDNPTGNISLKQVQPFLRNPLVESSALLSYGDYYQQYRILGTSPSYYGFYGIQVASGKLPQNPMEVALGDHVARSFGLKTGDRFSGNHGDATGEKHADSFVVTGILKESHSVNDQLIITPLASVWQVHHISDSTNLEVTAALVRFKNPMGMLTIPGIINKKTTLMAALPALEVNRLLSLFDNAFTALLYLAIIVVGIAVLSVFFSLLNSLKNRKYELALLRLQGAGKLQLFGLITFEALLLSFIGSILGLVLGKLTYLFIIPGINPGDGEVSLNFFVSDLWLILTALLIGTIAATIPAIKATQINITQLLTEK